MENYHLTVLEIREERVHIRCTGIAVINRYAEPTETGTFELDRWLPLITDKKDWEKFGLQKI